MAEFAINSSVNVSTGMTPFRLIHGKEPCLPIDLDLESNTPAAADFVKLMTQMINKAWDNIVKAQTSQKTQADKYCRDHTFQIRDKVMLSTWNLNLRLTHSCKLIPKWIGPFTIKAHKQENSFKLDLPDTYHIHKIFHVSLIKPYLENDDQEFPNHHQEPPTPILVNDQLEYEAKRILKKRTRHGKTEYLVEWKGYHLEDSTWEPLSNLDNASDLIKEFNSRNTSRAVLMITHIDDATVCWW